jgi:hypothetical protein
MDAMCTPAACDAGGVRAQICWVGIAIGCGGGRVVHDAQPPCANTIVYLDRAGGSYVRGLTDDAATNASVLVDVPRTLPPWPGDDTHWNELVACIGCALSAFAIDITEIDPGAVPHVELVFTTSYWGGTALTHAAPSGCRPGNQIEFVFGDNLPDPTRACEVAMDGFAEMTALLSPAYNCLDFTSPAADCGIRRFINADMPCVDATGQPAPCRCGGTTENTFLALAARFPACAARD